MEFISYPRNAVQNKKHKDAMKQVIGNTNYNYRAHNQSITDNQYASVSGKYTIFPGIEVNYPQPYMTGKCVSAKERKQIPFDLHKKTHTFSDLIRN